MTSEPHPLRIAWIGGHDRAESHLERAARSAGFELRCHDGHVVGPGGKALRRLIAWSDLVIILTDINSHRGVESAKAAARALGRPFHMIRACGPSRLPELMATVSRQLAA